MMLIGIAAVACLWVTAQAHAADRVYWTNETDDTVSFAALNGSGAGNLPVTGTTVSGPEGVTIDAAAGRIYWANYSGPTPNRLSGANLDGSGGQNLNTPGATVDSPYGVSVDPGGGRLYWANAPGGPDSVSFANLSGSGGNDLSTAGATTLNNPLGVAVDPAAGRLYIANYGASKIAFANLNGSGGADIFTGTATVNFPVGVAVDSAAGRIYWANNGADKISFANLNGSGGGDLTITGVTVNNPAGVTVDPAANRIYWANDGIPRGIFFAPLNGGAGGTVNTAGAATGEHTFPALLEAPAGAGAPAVTGKGKTLECSQGSWAPDLTEALLSRSPQTFAFQWSRDGAETAGATSSSLSAAAAGNYSCRVTAENFAGSTSQTSEPFAQFKIGKLKRNKRAGTGKLAVTLPGPGTLTLQGRGVVKQRPAEPGASSPATARKVSAAGTVKLLVRAKGKARRKLEKNGTVKLKLKLSFKPASGTGSAQTKRVKLIKRG